MSNQREFYKEQVWGIAAENCEPPLIDNESILQMCGSIGQPDVPEPESYERANYMCVLSSRTLRSSRR